MVFQLTDILFLSGEGVGMITKSELDIGVRKEIRLVRVGATGISRKKKFAIGDLIRKVGGRRKFFFLICRSPIGGESDEPSYTKS
jgi:hypothetical protein